MPSTLVAVEDGMEDNGQLTGGTGSQPQKGTITYAMSPNRQRPLAGAARNAVFNTFRRTSHQIGYWLPPILIAYYAMHWATKRYGTAPEDRKNDRD